jgi:hypothetical protein
MKHINILRNYQDAYFEWLYAYINSLSIFISNDLFQHVMKWESYLRKVNQKNWHFKNQIRKQEAQPDSKGSVQISWPQNSRLILQKSSDYSLSPFPRKFKAYSYCINLEGHDIVEYRKHNWW